MVGSMPNAVPEPCGSRFLPPPPSRTTFAGWDDGDREDAIQAFERMLRTYRAEIREAPPERLPGILRGLQRMLDMLSSDLLNSTRLERSEFDAPTPSTAWDEALGVSIDPERPMNGYARIYTEVVLLMVDLKTRVLREDIPSFADEL